MRGIRRVQPIMSKAQYGRISFQLTTKKKPAVRRVFIFPPN
jgi:hypothetical protein